MQKKTRSILDEITTLVPQRDKHLLVENLALQAIARITNLVKIIENSYPKHQSDELVRRLQLSIKNNEIINCDSITVSKVIDLTGAGDLFAAGFLKEYLDKSEIKKETESKIKSIIDD